MSSANDLERQMLDLINAERVSRGLNPVQLELRLNVAAEDHSEWMIATDTFSHTGIGGSTPTERIRDADFTLSGSWTTGENLAWQSERGATGLSDDVTDLHNRLMDSPGHRANILNPNFELIGIGIERGEFEGFDGVFVTQNFARTSAAIQLDNPEADRPEEPVADVPVVPEEPATPEEPAKPDGLRIVGTAGDDALNGRFGHDTLIGQAGGDTLKGGRGHDTLRGKTGDDALYGGNGNDRLEGGNGNDILNGNSGLDVIDGGRGDDRLKGGAGNDVFVFANDHGDDRITDFNAQSEAEVIDFSALSGFDTFDDVLDAASESNDRVTIETGSDSSILLIGVSLDQLDAGDFVF